MDQWTFQGVFTKAIICYIFSIFLPVLYPVLSQMTYLTLHHSVFMIVLSIFCHVGWLNFAQSVHSANYGTWDFSNYILEIGSGSNISLPSNCCFWTLNILIVNCWFWWNKTSFNWIPAGGVHPPWDNEAFPPYFRKFVRLSRKILQVPLFRVTFPPKRVFHLQKFLMTFFSQQLKTSQFHITFCIFSLLLS